MGEVLLNMTGIKKSFGGVQALVDGELCVEKGDVHGLIGENGAGKSTLMNILLGIHQADAGTIWYKGKEVKYSSPSEALDSGIAMIHQEVSLVPEMTVAENVWLGQENLFKKGGFINPKLMVEKTRELLDYLKIEVNPTEKVKNLSIAQMQLIEIVRAVSRNSDLVLMDEPTSALTDKEVDLLYDIVKRLTADGTTIVFISHKLPELFRFCDKLTVMRDGQFIELCDTKELSNDRLLQLIVGRENVEVFERECCAADTVALEVKNLCENEVFHDVSFSVRKGEILGFSGLMGAGRTEIMRAIFGCDRIDGGEVFVNGQKVNIKSPKEALQAGIGMVTEDRLRLGVIKSMSIMQNATVSDLKEFEKVWNLLDSKKENQRFDEISKELYLKYGAKSDEIGSLSGGNQQKVVFMRWLMTNCSILILDEPTRGIDVGAKTEIYKLIDRLARQGLAVLLVSSELPEVLALSDRIIVVREGEIAYECNAKDATQEILIKHAFGV